MQISILTVTLNAASCLQALADSIRKQGDHSNFEWVVVDGGSTDGTLDIIEHNKDLISTWISEPDTGFYDALNKAVQLANGDFYLVLGADDSFNEDAFEQLTCALDNADDADLYLFAISRSKQLVRPRQRTYLRRILGWSKYIASHSVGTLIRRDLHRALGMYSLKYPLFSDGHFLKLVFDAGYEVSLQKACLGNFAEGGMSAVDAPRSIAELWLVQVHTGENIAIQSILFLMRALKLDFQRISHRLMDVIKRRSS